MKKNEFRTPLIQSAAVLSGVLILFAVIASSGASNSEGGILAIIFGIGNLILFFIGMAIALLISIALLVAIFLAAVSMVDPAQAAQMYSDLKKNFSLIATSLSRHCCSEKTSEFDITKEEYDWMKQEIATIQEKNLILQENIKGLTGDNALLRSNVDDLSGENTVLKTKIDELVIAVEHLQASEKEMKTLAAQLTEKIERGTDQELKEQIKKLQQLQNDTRIEIENLVERIQGLESSGSKQAPTSGIFTYIEKEGDQSLFMQKVEEALSQELTYAQIDEYLTGNLPPELDKIIKDHPSLTKNYIRDLRKE